MTSIIVDEKNQNYDSRENCNAIIETNSNTLIAGAHFSTVPNGVVKIGYAAFWGVKFKRIVIPDSVKEIEDNAFWGCDLEEIIIPNNVNKIGNSAFESCSNMESITLSNSITEMGQSVFKDCIKLKSIYIPTGSFVKFEKLLLEYREILMEKVEIDGHKGLKRVLCKKELEVVYKAKVVQGQYTQLICFYMNDGCQKYIPLCKQSQLSIGDEVDLNKAKLIELSGEGIYYGYMDGREYYDNNLVDA